MSRAEKRDGIVRILLLVLAFLITLTFFYLVVAGVLTTCRLDPNAYVNENILFEKNSFVLNLLAILLLLAVSTLVIKNIVNRLNDRKVFIWSSIFLILTASLSILWVAAVQSIPATDSESVINAATFAAKNDYTFLSMSSQYFHMVPHQLGMVFLYEGLIRIFG
ncbi:MAG: hypothetical protein LLF75_00560 [Eubacteriales bacterium]|nr:hypothetical protein [Eubacteriales bacterium]